MGDDVRLLLAVFFGFYLIDCALLLRPTEALVAFDLRWMRPRKAAVASHWRRCIGAVDLSFGCHWLPLRGRIVAWLNPLTPWRLQFRCPPLVVAEAGLPSTYPSLTLHRMIWLQAHNRRLAPLLLLHGIVLFGVLPYFLILDRLGPLLMFLGLAFATALTIVLACLPARRLLHITHRAYWSMALQAIVCPPALVCVIRTTESAACSMRRRS